MPEAATKSMLKMVHMQGTKKYNTSIGTKYNTSIGTKTIFRSGRGGGGYGGLLRLWAWKLADC